MKSVEGTGRLHVNDHDTECDYRLAITQETRQGVPGLRQWSITVWTKEPLQGAGGVFFDDSPPVFTLALDDGSTWRLELAQANVRQPMLGHESRFGLAVGESARLARHLGVD